jgi:large repetitive protein
VHVHNEVVVDRITAIARRHRTRFFAVALLMLVVAGLTLAPLTTASADTTSTDQPSTQPSADTPADAAAVEPTATSAPDTAPTTTPTPTPTPAPAATPDATAPDSTAPAASPAASPVLSAPVADDDGVPADVEARAPHGGDNNQDGVADADQANVASLPAAVDVDGNGVLDDYVTIVSPPGTSLTDVRAVPVPSDTPPPPGVAFPAGLLDYQVVVAHPGDAADVKIIYPPSIASHSLDVFYALQDNTWINLTKSADLAPNAPNATIAMVDGGTGDRDHATNGVIDDPSGGGVSVQATGTLVIKKAGDRKADGSIGGAPGATFNVYSDSALTTLIGTCGPTDATGSCTVALNAGTNYYAKEVTPPAGFELLPTLATDSNGTGSGTVRDYTDKIGPFNVTSGGTTTLPQQPSGGQTTSNWGYNSGLYANRRINPTLPAVCGLKIALLLDMSGSIDTTEWGQMQSAATTFVTDLQGTPSQVGIYSFATAAPAATAGGGVNANLGATSVATAAGVTTVTNHIAGLSKPGNPNYFTNWDAGFASIPSGYDVVLVLTDGNPTVDSTGTSPVTTNFNRLENGIASANRLKTLTGSLGTNHTRILGVGIGIGANDERNLAAVSGGIKYDGTNATPADYFTTGFDQLGDTLAAIADAACGGSVSAVKQIQTGPGTFVTAPGWQYTVTPAPSSTNPVDGKTDANGAVNFSYSEGPWPKTVTVTENLSDHPGYSIVPQDGDPTSGTQNRNAACTSGGNLISGVTDITNGVTFSLTQSATVSCTFRNTPTLGQITVKKATSGGTGSGFNFTLTGPNSTNLAYDNVSTTSANPATAGTATGLFPGQYVVTETSLPAGWTIDSISCTGATVDVANPKATITLTAVGESAVCTFTNKPTTGTIELRKVWSGGLDGDTPATTNLQIGSTSGASNIANVPVTSPGNGTTTAKTVNGGTYFVQESGLSSGWLQTSLQCATGAGPSSDYVPATGVAVPVGGSVVCTVTNTRDTGTITLNKVWVGGVQDDRPTTTLHINGLSSDSKLVTGIGPSTLGPNTVVTGTYTVGETGLSPGWSQQSITCQNGTQAPFTPTDLGFAVNQGDSFVCTITNAKQGSITIVKDANPDAAQDFGFTPTGLPGGHFTLRDDGTTANTKQFPALLAGTYSVAEDANPAGWSLTSVSCVGAGGSGDLNTLTATIVLPPGGNVTCTFTNTGPDVGIVKTDAPDPVAAGANLTYSLAVHNYGPAVAVPAQVSDPLPANTTFVSFTASGGWSCTSPAVGATGTVSCSLPSLAVGADAPVITVIVKVGAGVAPGTNVISNTATVSTPNDSNPSNNSSTATTSVIRAVDLAVTKSDGGAQPIGGVPGSDGIPYTLTVHNAGPSDASADATITDVLPPGVDFASFGTLPAGVSCVPPDGQTIECAIAANLLQVAGPDVVIPLNVTVPASTAGGEVTNKVIVSSPEDEAPCTVTDTDISCEPSDTNNYAQVVTPVVQIAPDVVAPTAPPAQVEAAAASLAFTGSDAGRLGLAGAACVALGGLLVVAVRRRRRSGTS